MINKYAEIQKRALLYKAARYIYRVKTAMTAAEFKAALQGLNAPNFVAPTDATAFLAGLDPVKANLYINKARMSNNAAVKSFGEQLYNLRNAKNTAAQQANANLLRIEGPKLDPRPSDPVVEPTKPTTSTNKPSATTTKAPTTAATETAANTTKAVGRSRFGIPALAATALAIPAAYGVYRYIKNRRDNQPIDSVY